MSEEHEVLAGETLQRIAASHGFGDWQAVWWHPTNDTLRSLRKTPDVLYPGDIVHIPDMPPFKARTGTRNTFVAKRHVTSLRLQFQMGNNNTNSLANARFELEVGGTTIEGNCDEKGVLEVEVPCDEEDGRLTLWPDEDDPDDQWEIDLKIGHLDPWETTEGIQARLNNLGYHCGEHDGDLGERTQRALTRFRDEHDIEADSPTDTRVLAALDAAHGGTHR